MSKQETDKPLTPAQQQAVQSLADGVRPLRVAAQAAGVSLSTLMRWKKQPLFRRTLEETLRERLSDAACGALSVVREIMENADSDNVRLSAAKDILDRAGLKPGGDKKETDNELRVVVEYH